MGEEIRREGQTGEKRPLDMFVTLKKRKANECLPPMCHWGQSLLIVLPTSYREADTFPIQPWYRQPPFSNCLQPDEILPISHVPAPGFQQVELRIIIKLASSFFSRR